jgi:hypothetical protein
MAHLTDPSKRPRSLHSIQSAKSWSSLPIPPVKKKNKRDEIMEANWPSAGGRLGTASSQALGSVSSASRSKRNVVGCESIHSRDNTGLTESMLGGTPSVMDIEIVEWGALEDPQANSHMVSKVDTMSTTAGSATVAASTLQTITLLAIHSRTVGLIETTGGLNVMEATASEGSNADTPAKPPFHMAGSQDDAQVKVECSTMDASSISPTNPTMETVSTIYESVYDAEDDAGDACSYMSSAYTYSSQVTTKGDALDRSLPAREWSSAEELTGMFRRIDPDRPVDSFTDGEISDIKLAADYLNALIYHTDAFPLYVLLLKRYKSLPNYNRETFYSALVKYSLCAREEDHCEISQNLLREELECLDDSAPDTNMRRFMANMMLAHTYTRGHLSSDSQRHVDAASEIADLDGVDLISQLPDNDRSLDLLVYHNLVRLTDPRCDLMDHSTYREIKTTFETAQLEDIVIARSPGPFEIKDGKMQNPCIRSCLRWCDNEIRYLTSIPGTWKTIGRKAKEGSIQICEFTALFLALWERWQQIAQSTPESSADENRIWMTQTEKLMGISTTELLKFLSYQITYATTWTKTRKDHKLILRLQLGSQSLLREDDSYLAKKFLREYVEFNRLISWPAWRTELRNAARAGILAQLQKVLRLKVPGWNGFIEAASPPIRALGTVAVTLWPTLASSLSSLELNELYEAKKKIGRKVRNLVETSASLPSAVFRGGSPSKLSLISMSISELSHAMESSLSLSSRPRDSTSSRFIIVDV